SGGLISALFQATESQGIFPSPAWLKVLGGARAGGVACQATLVAAAPGWETCGLNVHVAIRLPLRIREKLAQGF
ncbi:MAG: hypothetical protein ACP5MD_12475, partial [Verrucomicrobiia bacterium]